MVEVSVLVPIYNEEKFLDNFLNSLLQQNIEGFSVELVFIDGDSEDKTVKLLQQFERNKEYTSLYHRIKILTNKKRFISSSLNIGLSASSGKFIIRLDVHSEIPSSYIKDIYILLKEKHVEYANVGGRTVAKGFNRNSVVFAKLLSSKWVLGGAQFRYSKEMVEVDTIFPGAWLKKDLLLVNGWNEEWIINEDVELNSRLKKRTNKKILLDPSISINYFPRDSYSGLFKQYFNYGYWRMKTANAHHNSIRISHLLPIFVLAYSLMGLTIAIINYKTAMLFLIVSILLYLFYTLAINYKIFGNSSSIIKGQAGTMVIQSAWIVGSLKGYTSFGVPIKGYYNLLKKLV